MYLLDTVVLSELRRRERNPRVKWTPSGECEAQDGHDISTGGSGKLDVEFRRRHL